MPLTTPITLLILLYLLAGSNKSSLLGWREAQSALQLPQLPVQFSSLIILQSPFYPCPDIDNGKTNGTYIIVYICSEDTIQKDQISTTISVSMQTRFLNYYHSIAKFFTFF